MKVQNLNPLDCYDDFAIPLDKWVNAPAFWIDRAARAKMAAAAEEAFLSMPAPVSGGLRHPPVVLYNPFNDGVFFLWKFDNGGQTVVVGLDQQIHN